MYLLGVSILPLPTILIFDFGIVFHFIIYIYIYIYTLINIVPEDLQQQWKR